MLFLHAEESYDLATAARLVRMSAAALRREARRDWSGDYLRGRTWRFTWRQLARIAFHRWSLAEIRRALGRDAARVLPPLLALRRVTVRLPEFILLALETLAGREGETLDAYLHRELLDFAGTWAREMERVHPGFRRAYLFPGQMEKR
jgi:hypothetical protein